MKKKINIYHPTIGFGELGEGIAHIGVFEFELNESNGKRKLEKNLRVYLTGNKSFVFGIEPCPTGEVYTDKKPLALNSNLSDTERNQLEMYESSNRCIMNLREEVYDLIITRLDKTIDFYSPNDRDVIAVWVIGTYFFPVFQTYPYLILSGPRGSGKTKVLDFLDCIAFNSVKFANTSVSALFRIIDANRCTVLIDEAETLRNGEESRDLGRILNAGYKSNANVLRTNPESLTVEEFNTYSPKAIASINRVDRVLGSRGINVNMIKTGDRQKGNSIIIKEDDTWGVLRDRLRVLYLDLAVKVDRVYRNDDEINQLSCRKNELWSPLLAISKVIGDDVFQKMKTIALGENDDDDPVIDDWDSHLLLGLNDLVSSGGGQYMVKEIKSCMTNRMEADQSAKVTSRWTGEALRRFGFTSYARTNVGYRYSIDKEKVSDLLGRYQLLDKTANSELSECSEGVSEGDAFFEIANSIFSNPDTEHVK